MKILEVVKICFGLSGVFALICFGLFFLELRETAKSLTATSATTAKAIVSIQKDVSDIKVMTNATLFQAEEVLHHTDVLIATQSKFQAKQMDELTQVLTQLQTTVQNVNESQKAITQSTTAALDTLPALTTQLQSTLAETQQTVAATGKTAQVTSQLVASMEPTVLNINSTTAHLNDISASLDTVVKNATKPKPWYKQLFGYVWAPIKIAAIFAK